MKTPLTQEDISNSALEASKNAYRSFGAILAQVEVGSLKIDALKPFLEIVQQRDREWLKAEATLREWEMRRLSIPPDQENSSVNNEDLTRQVALKYLEEILQNQGYSREKMPSSQKNEERSVRPH